MIRTRFQSDTPFFPNMLNNGKVEVCLKEDVDKVIAELENRIDDGDKDFEMANHQNEHLLKLVRHQKYKRCLAMARWCNERIVRIEKDYAFWRYGKDYAQNFYKKWKLRWLELAEKFKEAK